MNIKTLTCSLILVAFLLVGCGAQSPETPAPAPTAAPTTAPVADPTIAAPAEPTAIPTVASVSAEPTSPPQIDPTSTMADPTAMPAPTETAGSSDSTSAETTADPTAVPAVTSTASSADTNSAETPTIIDFSASHWTVGGGEPLTLAWEVSSATEVLVFLDTGGPWQQLYTGGLIDSFTIDWAQNQYPIPPIKGSNNDYILVANNNDQQTTHTIRVSYDASLAGGGSNEGGNSAESGSSSFAINNFALSSNTISDDGAVTATWDVSQAARIELITFTADENPEMVLHNSADARGSHQITYFSLPTFMFDSYGLDSLTILLRAFDANGNSVERQTELRYGRTTTIKQLSASPSPATTGQSLTLAFDVTWGFAIEVAVQRPSGEQSIAGDVLPMGSAGQPMASAAGNITLTWDELTDNGAHTFDSGEIVLIVRINGPDNVATQTITIPVQ